MNKLPFMRKEYPYDSVHSFEELADHDVPEKPGAYILMAQPGYSFAYPRGRSPVFYVGQAKNLRRRLMLHLKLTRKVRGERKLLFHWPRYEWAAVLRPRYTFVLTKPRERPKRLEENIIAMFATRYRAWPVANGSGSWNSMHHLQQLLEDEMRQR